MFAEFVGRGYWVAAGLAAVVYVPLGALLWTLATRGRGLEARFLQWRILLPAVLILGQLAFVPWVLRVATLTGDEPHYLTVAYSIARDGDLAVRNNYEAADYAAFYPWQFVPSDFHLGPRGVYSVHAPGLSVLLAPVLAVAGRPGVTVQMTLMTILVMLMAWCLATQLGVNPARSLLIFVLLCFAPPVSAFSSLVLPEVPAAGLLTGSLILLRPAEASWRRIAAAGVLLAGLPWLHVRFVVPLIAVIALQIVRPRGLVLPRFVMLVPVALSLAGVMFVQHAWFGSYSLIAGLGGWRDKLVSPFVGMAGLLVDQQYGLFTVAPIYVAAIAGWWWMMRRDRWLGATVGTVAVLTWLTGATHPWWWGGESAAARYLVSTVPLLGMAIAVSFDEVAGDRRRRWLLCTLLSVSLVSGMYFKVFPNAVPYGTDGLNYALVRLETTLGWPMTRVLPSLVRRNELSYGLVAIEAAAIAVATYFLLRRSPPNRT